MLVNPVCREIQGRETPSASRETSHDPSSRAPARRSPITAATRPHRGFGHDRDVIPKPGGTPPARDLVEVVDRNEPESPREFAVQRRFQVDPVAGGLLLAASG